MNSKIGTRQYTNWQEIKLEGKRGYSTHWHIFKWHINVTHKLSFCPRLVIMHHVCEVSSPSWTLACSLFDHRLWQICCRQPPSFYEQMSHAASVYRHQSLALRRHPAMKTARWGRKTAAHWCFTLTRLEHMAWRGVYSHKCCCIILYTKVSGA